MVLGALGVRMGAGWGWAGRASGDTGASCSPVRLSGSGPVTSSTRCRPGAAVSSWQDRVYLAHVESLGAAHWDFQPLLLLAMSRSFCGPDRGGEELVSLAELCDLVIFKPPVLSTVLRSAVTGPQEPRPPESSSRSGLCGGRLSLRVLLPLI